MISQSMRDAALAVGGALSGANVRFHGVSTDSRTLNSNELFVALKGERFDGHDSIAEAHSRGAAGALVGNGRVSKARLPQIEVADTRRALGELARAWRQRFDLTIVGITGSSGKTSTKEMLAEILRQAGPVLATVGNFNNDIGVPQTVFRLNAEHRYAVIEMGANRLHDIAELAAISVPSIAVVTMCGPAHLAGFGSIENVARAKGEIYRALGVMGIAVINADDKFAALWCEMAANASTYSFGIENVADVSASSINLGGPGKGSVFNLETPLGSVLLHLPFDGLHNVYNALAAATAAYASGATLNQIKVGLEKASRVHGRLNVRRGIRGAAIIDDSYNANPASLNAALAVLARSTGRRWLLLGDMAELGSTEVDEHRAAGLAARRMGVERLFALGPLSQEAVATFGVGARHFAQPSELVEALRHELAADVTLLAKGSRVMQLDQLVEALIEEGVAEC